MCLYVARSVRSVRIDEFFQASLSHNLILSPVEKLYSRSVNPFHKPYVRSVKPFSVRTVRMIRRSFPYEKFTYDFTYETRISYMK